MDDREGDRKMLDYAPDEAIRWAKTAGLRTEEALDDLGRALHELRWVRQHPAPEWRETQRLLGAGLKLLRETLEE